MCYPTADISLTDEDEAAVLDQLHIHPNDHDATEAERSEG